MDSKKAIVLSYLELCLLSDASFSLKIEEMRFNAASLSVEFSLFSASLVSWSKPIVNGQDGTQNFRGSLCGTAAFHLSESGTLYLCIMLQSDAATRSLYDSEVHSKNCFGFEISYLSNADIAILSTSYHEIQNISPVKQPREALN